VPHDCFERFGVELLRASDATRCHWPDFAFAEAIKSSRAFATDEYCTIATLVSQEQEDGNGAKYRMFALGLKAAFADAKGNIRFTLDYGHSRGGILLRRVAIMHVVECSRRAVAR
jgi:hypothetical protein